MCVHARAPSWTPPQIHPGSISTWRRGINKGKVKQVRAVYSEYVAKWFEFDLRRIEIEHVCPITIDYECAAMGACWDGSARC